MITYNNIKKASEKINVEIRALETTSRSIHYLSNAKAAVRIIRNLKDDTFTIEIDNEITSTGTGLEPMPYLSINGRVILDSDSDGDIQSSVKVTGNRKTYKIPSSMMKHVKLSDVSEIHVGLMLGDRVMSMYLAKLSHDLMRHRMVVNPNDVAEIQTPRVIEFKMDDPINPTGNIGTWKETNAIVNFEYSQLFYVPKKRDRNKHIEELADIYISESPNLNMTNIIPFEKSKVKTTANYTGLDTILEREINDVSDSIIDNTKEIHIKKVGVLRIEDSTYYDYEKGKTVKGYSTESARGELIPYNFHGSYNWSQTIKLFESVGNFVFETSKQFDNPLLDQYDGDIVLSITEDDNQVITNKRISLESLEIIKQVDNLSVRGIERLSIEKT